MSKKYKKDKNYKKQKYIPELEYFKKNCPCVLTNTCAQEEELAVLENFGRPSIAPTGYLSLVAFPTI